MDGAGDDLEKEVARLRRVVNQLERSTSDVRPVPPPGLPTCGDPASSAALD